MVSGGGKNTMYREAALWITAAPTLPFLFLFFPRKNVEPETRDTEENNCADYDTRGLRMRLKELHDGEDDDEHEKNRDSPLHHLDGEVPMIRPRPEACEIDKEPGAVDKYGGRQHKADEEIEHFCSRGDGERIGGIWK